MGCLVRHIVQWMEALAPPELAEQWDRVGLQVGHLDRPVERILLTLTITPAVVQQAQAMSADMIVAHHPLIFRPLTELRWDRPSGALLRSIITSDIAVLAAHTNYDAAEQGTSHVLARRLGLQSARPLVPHTTDHTLPLGFGRVGELARPMAPDSFLQHTMSRLELAHVRHNGMPPNKVERVAVMGGSGASFIDYAVGAQADVYVTGDVKFHDALDAQDVGVWVIDAGHFGTERLLVHFWKEYLERQVQASEFDVTIAISDEADPFHVAVLHSNA